MSDQDRVLRARIIGSLSRVQVYEINAEGEKAIEDEADNIMQLFATQKEQVAREARIAELERIDGYGYGTDYGDYQRDRLEALQKEAEHDA